MKRKSLALPILLVRADVRATGRPFPVDPIHYQCRSGKCGRCHECRPRTQVPVAFTTPKP